MCRKIPFKTFLWVAFLLLVIAVVAQCVVPEELCSSVVTVVQTNDVWCVIVPVVAGFARPKTQVYF